MTTCDFSAPEVSAPFSADMDIVMGPTLERCIAACPVWALWKEKRLVFLLHKVGQIFLSAVLCTDRNVCALYFGLSPFLTSQK